MVEFSKLAQQILMPTASRRSVFYIDEKFYSKEKKLAD